MKRLQQLALMAALVVALGTATVAVAGEGGDFTVPSAPRGEGGDVKPVDQEDTGLSRARCAPGSTSILCLGMPHWESGD